MNKIAAEILIVGGGAAGISAAVAIAENSDASVAVVDDNPYPGGQIWRREPGKAINPALQALIDRAGNKTVKLFNNAQVFGAPDSNSVLAEMPSGACSFQFGKLIIATGARERFLPFPNWTVRNVYGAAGLQALVKSGLPVAGKRIVVAGTGPLLLAAADYLRSKGARILLVAEQATRSSLLRFGLGLWKHPRKLAEAAAIRLRLGRTTYLTDCFVTGVVGRYEVEGVELTSRGRDWTVECDLLACGFHLVPNTELASLLGCRLDRGFVEVGRLQETSVTNVYCAGEPTGIGGVELSLIEGRIAGLAAIGQDKKAESLFRKRAALNTFSEALAKAFAIRPELRDHAADEVIACRCEDVRIGQLQHFGSWREAKLQTRCGMGPCQGRICSPIADFLFGWKDSSVRPPIFPVRMCSLAEFTGDDEE